MGFYKPVVKYLKMNKIYKIKKNQKKKTTHIFQPPAGLLIPGRKTEGSCVWEKMKVKNKTKQKKHRASLLSLCVG